MRATGASTLQVWWVAIFPQILPVLMLHGSADLTAPLAGAQELAAARSTWEMRVLDGVDHLVAQLLDRGVPVNAVYENQLTALMWSAGQGHADVVRLLLARGADPTPRDDRGLRAADMATQAGHAAVAALLQGA